jgi:hypothetical protein
MYKWLKVYKEKLILHIKLLIKILKYLFYLADWYILFIFMIELIFGEVHSFSILYKPI